jgi:ribosomal protein L7/L12
MDTFEERVRMIAADNPRLSVSSAVYLADQEGDPVAFPDDPADAEMGAVWAMHHPTVVETLRTHGKIYAIKEVRALAPARVHTRSFGKPVTLGLLEAKNIVERLHEMLEG